MKKSEYKHKSLLHFLFHNNPKNVKPSLQQTNFESCLSSYVSKIVLFKKNSSHNSPQINKENSTFISDDGLLNFTKLNEGIDKSKKEYINFNDRLSLCKFLINNVKYIDDYLQTKKNFEIFYENELLLLKEENLILPFLQLYTLHMKKEKDVSKGRINSFIVFSILSTLIERILYSLLTINLKKKFDVFPVLSEILTDVSLEKIFDSNLLKFMECLIGSPLGLNLRNIIWHGFISCSIEFSSKFTSVLFLVILTMLNEIKKKKECLKVVWKGHEGMEDKIKQIKCDLKGWSLLNMKDESVLINEIISNSWFIIPDRIEIVKKSYLEFFQGNYLFSLVLILPQIEHFLRRIYILQNNLSEKMLLAQSRVLFTTLDIILDFYVRENEEKEDDSKKVTTNEAKDRKKNLIYEEIGENNTLFLKDLLIFKDGYRMRDNIAHCEIHPSKIPKEFVDFILSYLMTLFYKYTPIDFKSKNIKSKHLNTVIEIFGKYKSKFSPKALLLKNLYSIFKDISLFMCNVSEEEYLFVREVREFACEWSSKMFMYKNMKKKKGGTKVLVCKDIEKVIQEEINIVKLNCKENFEKIDMEVLEYFDSKKVKMDHFEVSVKRRKELNNNIHMCQKVITCVKNIITKLNERKNELELVIKGKKARTPHRKRFGCIVKTKFIIQLMMKLLVLNVQKEIFSDFENLKKEKDLVKSHKRLYKVFCVASKMFGNINEGQVGYSILEYLKSILVTKKCL